MRLTAAGQATYSKRPGGKPRQALTQLLIVVEVP
jgi:hypothetical protein